MTGRTPLPKPTEGASSSSRRAQFLVDAERRLETFVLVCGTELRAAKDPNIYSGSNKFEWPQKRPRPYTL